MEPRFKTYLFDYEFDGQMWGFEMKAASEEEAVRRVRALSTQALILGERKCVICAPSWLSFIVRAVCAIRNFFA